VRITVADDGPGMTPEVRARCMEPFFTTKARGISTGLGLSLVFALVREARGDIRLDSEPGRGAAFTLELPVARPPEPPGRHAERLAVVSVRRPQLRAFINRQLESMRFRVTHDASAMADLLVIDHAAEAAPAKPGATVVALDRLAGAPGPHHAPTIAAIRRRLEEVAAGAPEDAA
jgi:hypothetical protein